ncbi:hypothetical protein CGLO_14526 [Colletotrichum gloeosporioides Cg-14]|uniref:Uncharacterized protein n=1 Tax=Colletotrichum gloeosporioides (strain Cg-14) TaxID=1237896 RepID=T0L430_COLGC|nr:hypothetical protein CGLO_14526 [Colletotrichum gloeosporioides Cg-14]
MPEARGNNDPAGKSSVALGVVAEMWLPGKPLVQNNTVHSTPSCLPFTLLSPPSLSRSRSQSSPALQYVRQARGLGRGDVVVVEAFVSRLHAALYHSNVLREQGLQSQKRRPS